MIDGFFSSSIVSVSVSCFGQVSFSGLTQKNEIPFSGSEKSHVSLLLKKETKSCLNALHSVYKILRWKNASVSENVCMRVSFFSSACLIFVHTGKFEVLQLSLLT